MTTHKTPSASLHHALSIAALVLALAIPALAPSVAHALKSDRNQPAVINADDVELDFKDGTRTYTGNVTVVQGSMRLTCDKLVAKFKDGKLSLATAFGSAQRLALFKQRPDEKPYDVIGRAITLELDQIQQMVRLKRQASLQQGADSIAGETILYDMANDKMSVKGRSETQLKSKSQSAAPAPSSSSSTAAVPKAPERPKAAQPAPATPAPPPQPAAVQPVAVPPAPTPAPQPVISETTPPAPVPAPTLAPAPTETAQPAGTTVNQTSTGRVRIVLPPKSQRGN